MIVRGEPMPIDDAEMRLAERDARRVELTRALAERLLAGLRASETKAGHLAQKVGHESLGYCGWRSESPRCVEHRALVAELQSALEEAWNR